MMHVVSAFLSTVLRSLGHSELAPVPVFGGARVAVVHGDSWRLLEFLPEGSIDSVVCDPPYGLEFMNKGWDAEHGPAFDPDFWRVVLRVLKPGGYLVAFSGTRTYHRMVVAIEDAGFLIRDSIHWLYGSGFPKNLDLGKAIDKLDAAEERRRRALRFTAWVRHTGASSKQLDEATSSNMVSHYVTDKAQPCVPTREHLELMRPTFAALGHEVPEWVEALVDDRVVESENYKQREVVGRVERGALGGAVVYNGGWGEEFDLTAPYTPQAERWEGWGTALKPAHEPICLAQKPREGTFAANVVEHGVGAMNVDGCRVGDEELPEQKAGQARVGTFERENMTTPARTGRWPSNVVWSHAPQCVPVGVVTTDGEDLRRQATLSRQEGYGLGEAVTGGEVAPGVREVYACVPWCPGRQIDAQSGPSKSRKGKSRKGAKGEGWGMSATGAEYDDAGGASRFYYCAKPSRKERDANLEHLAKKTGGEATDRADGSKGLENPRAGAGRKGGARNFHPTVKPIKLMQWLCRLVTPPGGVVLDPFAGSGTTGIAALREGFRFVGVELTDEYLPILVGRVGAELEDRDDG